MEQNGRNKRKTETGTVISNKMENTVVVQVVTVERHPRYGKIVKRAKKRYAHDKSNALEIGQEVRIVETRPYSKTKRWRVVDEPQASV